MLERWPGPQQEAGPHPVRETYLSQSHMPYTLCLKELPSTARMSQASQLKQVIRYVGIMSSGRRQKKEEQATKEPSLPPPLIWSWRDKPPAHKGQRMIVTSVLPQDFQFATGQIMVSTSSTLSCLKTQHLSRAFASLQQTDAYCLWPRLGCWHQTRTSPYRSHSLHLSCQKGRKAEL